MRREKRSHRYRKSTKFLTRLLLPKLMQRKCIRRVSFQLFCSSPRDQVVLDLVWGDWVATARAAKPLPEPSAYGTFKPAERDGVLQYRSSTFDWKNPCWWHKLARCDTSGNRNASPESGCGASQSALGRLCRCRLCCGPAYEAGRADN